MDVQEARAWLQGERSNWNTFYGLTENHSVNVAMSQIADAGSMITAFVVLLAESHGMLTTGGTA